ncbi:hypothetical protein TNCV_2373691 [Trichonephila clavipes]|nr:hypothetical protein TNCV_2373691 [Trichonephila clavipes]
MPRRRIRVHYKKMLQFERGWVDESLDTCGDSIVRMETVDRGPQQTGDNWGLSSSAGHHPKPLSIYSTQVGSHDSLVVKVTDSWPACREFEPSTVEDPPCRTGTFNMSRHERPVNEVWKLGEEGVPLIT